MSHKGKIGIRQRDGGRHLGPNKKKYQNGKAIIFFTKPDEIIKNNELFKNVKKSHFDVAPKYGQTTVKMSSPGF